MTARAGGGSPARRLVCVVGLAAALAASAAAQTDPRLREAVQLAQAGRLDTARVVVDRLLAALAASDSVYPEALYTAAILAPDAPTVLRHLQRVVVEYESSAWADDALLRLTQLHFAQNDPAATVRAAERLRRDFPDSPLVAQAAFPAARAYFDLRDEAGGCDMIRLALGGTGDDVELRNQVSFYAARCPAPGTPSDSAPAQRPLDAAGFAVQVLAVRGTGQVDEMLTRLRGLGYAARVVRDTTGLFKVWVGPYRTRDEAQRAQQRLRTQLGGQPFLVDDR